MAPNPRVAMAFRAMRSIGIAEEKVKPVLKSLLKLYDKNWELIEDENYRVLADAIFEYDETEVVEQKKKNVNTEQEEGLEEEAQVEDEPERPLKRLRLRYQESQVSPLSNSTPELGGSSYKKPTVEESKDITESPKSNTENTGAESNSFSSQPLIRNKGKQPVLPKPMAVQESSEASQPGVTKRYESDSISPPTRLRDKGKEILSSPVVTREKRQISLGIEPGIILLPKQKIPASHSMIKPKDEPFTDDTPQYEVPIAVIHPESLTKGNSSIGNGLIGEPHGPEPLASRPVHREDKGDGAQASSSATMASCELANVRDESAANLEIASSSPFGEEKTNATPTINVMYKSNSPDALDGRDMAVAVSPSDGSVHVQPLGATLPSSVNGSDDCLQPDKNITENCSEPENEKEQKCLEVTNSRRSLHDGNDIARGQERVVISFVNEINSEGPPSFNYIPRNVVFQNAYVNFSLARIGDNRCCSTCFGNCLSSSTPCACARETSGDFAYTLEGLVKKDLLEECISMNRDPQKHCHYYCEECPLERSKNGDSLGPCKGHLVRKFIKECWWKCGCNRQCGNRVVQRGINCNLQVFMTAEGKGWGLRTLEDLPKGAFVCEYVGEVLTNAELYDRVSQSSSSEEHAYPVLLDADWGSEGVLKDEEALCLDATYFGNVARFINHRCVDSNLVEIPVEVETPDHHYYHLAFFTTRKVKAMEELTWDYGIDFDDDNHPVKAFQCQCSSKLCRNTTHSSPTASKQSTPSPTTSKTKQSSTSKGKRQRGDSPQYRSTMSALERIMKTIQLKERHKTALKKTPFWDFIEAFISNRVHPSNCRKSDNKVTELLHAYKPKHKAFQLGGKIVRLRTSDISLIFGIPSGKIPMSLSHGKKPNTSFITRRLEDIERMSSTIIKDKLLDALKGNRKVDIEDVARLLCLYLCVTLFFATRGNSIGWAFIRYIENLEDMRNYAWSEAIHYSLMSSIEKSYHSPGKVTGCVPALLYWLCEHTTILQPLEQTQYPRFLKWDIGKLQEELTISRLNNLTNKEVHGAELRRTKEEKSLQTREVEEEEKGEVTKRTKRKSGSKSRATRR